MLYMKIVFALATVTNLSLMGLFMSQGKIGYGLIWGVSGCYVGWVLWNTSRDKSG